LNLFGDDSTTITLLCEIYFAGLYSSYTFAEAPRTDLLRMSADAALSDTRSLLAQHSYLAQRWSAFLVHLLLGTALLVVIWFGRIYEPEVAAGTDNKPESPQNKGSG